MFEAAYFSAVGLGRVHAKVLAGERLNADDGMALFQCPDLTAVGTLAAHVRFRMHGAAASYVVNRQINYTNICVNGCRFCAFRRDDESQPGAFALDRNEILARIGEAVQRGQGLDELHMVGGCHPDMGLAWFEDLFKEIHARYPELPLKAFTPVEIEHFAKMAGISTLETMRRLKDAGLVMLAGGGAEIFDSEIRSRLCPTKATADAWLRISGEAHSLGLKTNCTMLFGHIEDYAHRVDHLLRLREQQDKSGGFTCFIPLPFLQKNNRLRLPEKRMGPGRGLDQLKTIAVSRLLLDNIRHIKAYWIMLGEKLAQTALWYGADDLDGTIVEEHIGHMAGAGSSQGLTIAELEDMIRKSGFQPKRRNAVFDAVAAETGLNEFALAHDPLADAQDDRLLPSIRKARNGERLTRRDAENLYFHASPQTLAALAHAARLRLHPDAIVTYVGDRNINYSNICVCQCRFCAFFRKPGQDGGYVITRAELADKIEETLRLGGTQILLQGGHNPDLPLEWYEDMLAFMRKRWPELHIHAFSPPEISFWSQKFNLPVKTILQRLMAAGLDSIPGGGAEVLHDAARQAASPNKCSAAQWLDVMRTAHRLGMKTTATMMFGHVEKPGHRLDHLFALRELQDETGGFTAFIPWTFQPGFTSIKTRPLPAPAYLRLLAISRLVLDNIPNIQASWVTMGPDIAQLALFYGANDFGSLMIEENVVAAAGVSWHMSREDIHRVIRAAGFTPRQRRMDYTLVEADNG